MPSKGAYILLPQNSKIAKIDILSSEKIKLGSGYSIKPDTEKLSYKKIDNNILKSENINRIIPENIYSKIGVHNFRGYQILVLNLYPIEYNSLSGELFYYPELTVRIETKPVLSKNTMYRNLLTDEKQVLAKVDNPKMISSYKGYFKFYKAW